MRLSDNFTLEEAVTSNTATTKMIDNNPAPSTITVMKNTAAKMELVRKLLGVPIHINSWYRSPALNMAVGSKPSSQHILGQAVDFIAPLYGSPVDICRAILNNDDSIPFDQLILEHTWVHISFSLPGVAPRYQVLSLLANKTYATGLTDTLGKPCRLV